MSIFERVLRTPRPASAAPVVLCLLLGLAGAARADEDRWYQIRMMDQPAGWMHSIEKTADDKVTISTDMTIKVKRGPIDLTITTQSTTIETTDGKAVSMKNVQKLGTLPITQEFLFAEDGITIVTEQNGKKTTSKQPLPAASWLPPAAANRYAREERKKGAAKIEVTTMDPSAGPMLITLSRRKFEKTTIELGGKNVEVEKNELEASYMPGVVQTEYADENGDLVRADMNFGGIEMTMVSSTREEALREDAAVAPELMVRTFVVPDKPIEGARAKKFGSYILSIPGGDLPELPTTSAQKFERLDGGTARLTVDMAHPTEAPEADAANAQFLASSSMIDTQDDKIKELAAKATERAGDKATAAEKAEAIRRFVYTYIKKKALGVGFASASEVAQTCEGDCTEHGVLLTALLRASGIPARVVTGLIYADQFAGSERIFGYHCWAQALVEKDGKKIWLDVDATLPPTVPFDATHLAAAVTSLADGEMSKSMAGVAPLFGQLKIKVEKVK